MVVIVDVASSGSDPEVERDDGVPVSRYDWQTYVGERRSINSLVVLLYLRSIHNEDIALVTVRSAHKKDKNVER